MSRTPRIKSFADLATHLSGMQPGAGERQSAPSRRAGHRDARPPAHPVAETAAARYRIGWHPRRGAYFVLADDDPGYVVRIINLGSAKPELTRLCESHGQVASRLDEARPREAALVRAVYDAYRRDEHPAALVHDYLSRARSALEALEARFADGGYIPLQDTAALRALADGAEAALAQARVLPGAAGAERAILDLRTAAAAVPRRVAMHNQEYVRTRLELHREFFDSVEEKPLTQRQREAAVVEENRHLVVAGAGTGKTSTIVARVAYLIQRQAVPPEQILVLAYNETVEKEIRARLARRGAGSVPVHTFHGFGMEVIARVKGRKPPVSNLARQPGERTAAIRRGLERARNDARRGASLVRFLAEERYSAESEPVYRTLGEYLAATRRPRFLTLDGRFRVKSLAEVRIADWLCRNGVGYEYEAVYPHHRPSGSRAAYRPDFFLPDAGVYIEHFGVDRQGNPAPHIDRDNYWAGIRWKRRLHQQHGTRLVETWQYEAKRLGEVLESRLSAEGVRFAPRTDDEVLELVLEHHAGRFVRLADRFLQSFRENLWTMDRVRTSGGYAAGPGRTAAFLDVFQDVLAEYEGTLEGSGEIDYPAMIGLAADALRAGSYASPFTHVVIDELQDISHARCALVRALLEQPGHERKLFAVGDDWQSIYRFSGSDVSIMTHFGQHLGQEARSALDHTFRFSDRLAELSARFILKNPEQIDKRLSAVPASGPAATVIHATDAVGLRAALDSIRAHSPAPGASVLVLSRYNASQQQGAALRSVGREYPELAIRQSTIHRAKGAEADFVVILGLTSAYPAFPSEQTDDPLLRLLVPGSGSHPDAEERRLFYVALTRARRHVYLVAPQETPSRFLTELLTDEYAGLVASLRERGAALPCAVCRTGTLVEHRHGRELYWTCTNHPGCNRRVRACRACARAPLVRADAGLLRCANPECGHGERMCPRCGGQLIEHESSGGRFLGCSEWRRDRPGCFFTEPV